MDSALCLFPDVTGCRSSLGATNQRIRKFSFWIKTRLTFYFHLLLSKAVWEGHRLPVNLCAIWISPYIPARLFILSPDGCALCCMRFSLLCGPSIASFSPSCRGRAAVGREGSCSGGNSAPILRDSGSTLRRLCLFLKIWDPINQGWSWRL